MTGGHKLTAVHDCFLPKFLQTFLNRGIFCIASPNTRKWMTFDLMTHSLRGEVHRFRQQVCQWDWKTEEKKNVRIAKAR
jgi:hypothetical protein